MKSLQELCRAVPGAQLNGADVQIASLATDSRAEDLSGALFICIKGGSFDAHDVADKVAEKGAAALVVERLLPVDLPQILVSDSREAWSYLASAWFGDPAKKLRLIGVTGTKGKTTTTTLIARVLEHAGYKVGLIGTVTNEIAGVAYPQHLTTPDPMELQELLARMVDAGCTFAVMEVSAHAAALRKVAGLEYEVMGFTNLSQDHLNDFHTMENYGAAKAKLFQDHVCRMAIANGDDPYTETLLKGRTKPSLLFSLEGNGDILADRIASHLSGVSYEMNMGGRKQTMRLHLGGRFNVANSLLAAAICAQCGLPLDTIAEGLACVPGVAGRLERVDVPKDITVLVDYAHSPDSLENVLNAVLPETKGDVWAVFGCGGDRDRGKRPLMGAIAERLAKHVVITTDNPRTEDPDAIIQEIASGLRDPGSAHCITDRTEAIRYALDMARSGDTVVIAGKGHETYQEINGIRHHYDDREVVRSLCEEMTESK